MIPKKIVALAIAVMLIVPVTSLAFAQAGTDEAIIVEEQVDLQTQIELLTMLFDYNVNPNDYVGIGALSAFTDVYGYEQIDIPRITVFSVPRPEKGEDCFFIALDSPPTEEKIQFILDFTGICRDNIEISHFEQFIPAAWCTEELETDEYGFYMDFFENSDNDFISCGYRK